MNQNYFSIPEPCNENWNKMTATEQGAFCSKCAKEVIDLSAIKTAEIKPLIARKNNPCIRILERQIDEMNFIEWFGSISLRKQLKYLFLFTFLFVFKFNGITQDTDRSIIPYINERAMELPTEQNIITIEPDLVTVAQDTLPAVFDTTGVEKIITAVEFLPYSAFSPYNEVEHITNEITWMGIPTDCKLIIHNEFEIVANNTENYIVGGSLLMLQGNTIQTPPPNDRIKLGNNIYTFVIIGDELHFTYTAAFPEKIRLKIYKSAKEMVYFNSLKISVGQNTVVFPLDDFTNGQYTITVENGSNSESTEVIYW